MVAGIVTRDCHSSLLLAPDGQLRHVAELRRPIYQSTSDNNVDVLLGVGILGTLHWMWVGWADCGINQQNSSSLTRTHSLTEFIMASTMTSKTSTFQARSSFALRAPKSAVRAAPRRQVCLATTSATPPLWWCVC